jgi:hypothetical protein
MIIETKKKGNVTILIVKKNSKFDIDTKANTKITRSLIPDIINYNADVYTDTGKLLLRFRKKVLNNNNIDEFYKNTIDFAKNTTNNRGSAIGSSKKNIKDNPKVQTNIIGYFDTFSPKQKFMLKNHPGILTVRETRFNNKYPNKFKNAYPLIKEIDELYSKIVPDKYKEQRKKANQTFFKIKDTSFSTVTLNVNFQTTIHTDKGDDPDGFGNLVVIEHGEYSGGETCFPEYGIGVNVRTGDILFMDVHEPHGNLPIVKKTEDAQRLSVVCYLRLNIWKKTKGKTRKFMNQHLQKLNMLLEQYQKK